MRRLARPCPSSTRVGLDAGWALARGRAGEGLPAGAEWQPLPGPWPVAAALARSGAWSLDGPPRDFDAETWWYRCRFDRPAGEAPWVLGLDGLASLAQLWLNGEPLLASRNMFRAHELPLADTLRPQGNELLIRFDPLQQALAERRPRPRWRVPMVAHQQLRWWRTTLIGRTPGWSPPAALVGPWRPVWLEAAEPLRLSHLALRAELVGDRGVLHVELGLADAGRRGLRVRVLRDGDHAAGETPVEAALQATAGGRWAVRLELPQVRAWWPHTHGEPALYRVELLARESHRATLGRVGFRRLRIDQDGGGFRIVVNDVPVFARGACWTPLDTLRLHATPARYEAALAQLRAAGLNLLRVSGAMAYEDDAFLDACDAHGVMLWQDLMFAGMDYPADDPAWLAEIDEEVAQQMTRLQARPCVAVVCGNAEVAQQAAMWGAPRELWAPALFHQHLPGRIAEHLPGTPYWPCSTHGGSLPFQPSQGTANYYGIGAYRRGLDDARSSGLRFATECLGFANIPGDTTLARLRELNGGHAPRPQDPLWKARGCRDLGAGYDFDDVLDHYVERLFGVRPDELRRHDPARALMLGRAAGAEAFTAAFSQWRATGSACGGALVWFLRDFWAGAGWGVLDDQGGPKSVFHALARACQPLHLGVTDDGLNGLTLHLVNERALPLDAALSLALYRDGEVAVAQAGRPLALAPRDSLALPLVDCLEGFGDWSWAYRFGPPPADVLVARCLAQDGTMLAECVHFIDAGERTVLRRAELGLQAHSVALADGRRRVTLRSRAAARSVHFEAEGWQADDEFFNLAPGAERVVDCRLVGDARKGWRPQVHAINALAPVLVKEGA